MFEILREVWQEVFWHILLNKVLQRGHLRLRFALSLLTLFPDGNDQLLTKKNIVFIMVVILGIEFMNSAQLRIRTK